MFKKSELKTIANCQQALRSLIDVEFFCYDVKTISFYFGTTKIILNNADSKAIVDKGPKLADLQLACMNFSATYNYNVVCKVNNEGLLESTTAIYQWDSTTERMVLLPLDENFQAFECPPLPDDETVANLVDRPIVPFDSETNTEVKTEKIEVKPQSEKVKIEKTQASEPITPELVEDITPIKLPSEIGVYIVLSDKENQSVKKRLPISLESIRPHLMAWLSGTDQHYQGQLAKFKEAIKSSKHNALTLYLYRPYTWQVMDVAGDKQLRKVEVTSAKTPEIRTQKKGSITQNSRDAIPELGSMYTISPVKILESGNIYLAQTYIELSVDNDYLLRSRKIAIFENGTLKYHSELIETERDKHDIHPLVEADGKRIFPQMSIAHIELQTLEPNPNNPEYYLNVKKPHYEPVIGGKLVLKSSITPDTDMSQFVKVGNDYLEYNTYLNTPIKFEGFKHPNISPKAPKKHEITQRQNVKPVKIHNEKVVSGQIEFTDVVSTVPMLLRLTPSQTGYALVGLPLKLPDDFTYDLARYIASNLGQNSIGYLNSEIQRVKSSPSLMIGRFDKYQLLSALEKLAKGVLAEEKLDPKGVLESKNKLKAYMGKQDFYSSSVDPYFSFYPLASVKIVQETESLKYSYRLTNFGDSRGLIKNNLSSVQTWIQRISYNLKNYFGVKKPDFNEVKNYLKDNFKFKNCNLKVYYSTGIFFEVWHLDQMVAKQLISIIDPANTEKVWNISVVNIARNIQFGDNRIFEKVLKCNNLIDSDLIQFAKSQLSKVVDKFITANEKKLVGEGKIKQTTAVKEVVGFDKTSHGFSNIKSTFLRFITPFSIESEVDKGKLFNLRTGKILDRHSANDLFETMVKNWKQWGRDKDSTIHLGGYEFKKPNPGKLMLEIHHKVSDNPELDKIIWPEVIEIWWQLTNEPIGFRTSSGVVLTPWSIHSNRVDIWEYRIKMQKIDILRDQKTNESKPDRIKSHLQLSIERLTEILDKTYPIWYQQISEDVRKHLDALEEALELAKESDNV